MIQKLTIQNFAIIDRVEIQFSDYLTIITGETGAGKSIMIEALGLILGNRAEQISFFNPTQKCFVEGIFEIGKYNVQSFFEENELDYDTTVIVRREIAPSGKSRAFINDTPVNLKLLQQLSASLIDLHQQFDTLDIHEVSFQLRMVDALADNKKLLANYSDLYKEYAINKKNLAHLREQSEKIHLEKDFIEFQLTEFQQIELEVGMQEVLEADLNILNNAESIKRVTSQFHHAMLESDNALLSQWREQVKALATIRKYHSEVNRIVEQFDSFHEEVKMLCRDIESVSDQTEYNPEKIQELNDKLNAIYKLQKKHHVADIQQLIDIKSGLEAQLDSFDNLEENIKQLSLQIENQEKVLWELSKNLSEKRKEVAPHFEEKVHQMLQQISMENARLKVRIQPLHQLTPVGTDAVEFFFASNKGSQFLPIKDIASGGELSRLNLVTKSLVASAIPLPTLVFDEIDSGISGDVALKMGKMLQQLSRQHQVISITHSPQIASKADRHFFIYKQDTEEKTIAKIRQLTKEERIVAIAEMLSSKPPSGFALKNAKELIEK